MRPIRWLALAALLAPQSAMAAPFCMVILGMQPQCLYYDASLCQRDATKQGGVCEPDISGQTAGRGSGKYCVVTSQGAALCNYLNIESCQIEAIHLKGACYFDGLRSAGAPNPYAFSNGPDLAPPQ
jgi:hypothetical protein